jgi:hypothetical protein
MLNSDSVIPGRCEASNPESRDSGSDADAPSRNDGVLDTPLEPVIGLAEGETRWRSMTVFARSEAK